MCLTVVIWPIESYLRWSEDAPWLSTVGCVRLVHAGGLHVPGWSHPYSSTHLKYFLDSSPQRHTQTPPVAEPWWMPLKTVWCQDMLWQIKKKNRTGETKPWYLKCILSCEEVIFLYLFCTLHSKCSRMSSTVVLDCRMDCRVIDDVRFVSMVLCEMGSIVNIRRTASNFHHSNMHCRQWAESYSITE